jgi:enoyl-CoA hydratase/carnithine racemase
MNREHRYNTLSSAYIKDLKRFLTTLNQDNEVKVILMSGANDEHFSNGTDFRTLHHMAKEENHDKIVDYL